VENVFELVDGESINGKHLLLIDDVVTTGATIIACAKEIQKVNNVKISVLALGFAKS
jgi:predicted amidophosphoribosyltransferase